jgi:hypothetical protein
MTAWRGSIADTELGRSADVTAIAPESDKLRQLDDATRQAWSAYSERLRELTGEEYERAEHESWTQLQSELRRVERRRRSLNESTTS